MVNRYKLIRKASRNPRRNEMEHKQEQPRSYTADRTAPSNRNQLKKEQFEKVIFLVFLIIVYIDTGTTMIAC